MPKTYFFKFGAIGASYSGLSPSFTVFQLETGTTAVPPGITARISGTGFYQFSFNGTSYGQSLAIAFTIDGSASIPIQDRFVQGVLDPVQAIDQTILPMSVTLAALSVLGSSLSDLTAVIGNTTSSFGTTATDPGTVFGMLKRNQEFQEGNATFNKDTGIWDIYSRGSSTLLREKTFTNSQTTTQKS